MSEFFSGFIGCLVNDLGSSLKGRGRRGVGAGDVGDALSASEGSQGGGGMRAFGTDGRGGRGGSGGVVVMLHFFFTIG